jgi:Sulfotransferase family
VADISAGGHRGNTGASIAAPAGNSDDTPGGQQRQPVQPQQTLEAVIWARPVFVVGCPRSGTTLVQTMLDSHPSLSVLYEANALVDVPLSPWSCRASAAAALAAADAHPNSPAHGFDVRAARHACEQLGIADAAGAMRVLAASHALARGKKRWGTKTPKALLHLAELARVYPDAQFIHVIRDGRDSAGSQVRWNGRPAVQGALLWRTGIRAGWRAGPGLGPDRYLEVRLEEFLASPEQQIRGMCGFLGEDFDRSLLCFNTTARDRVPSSDLPIHPRLGEPPRPLPPNRDGAATGRAVTALIQAELTQLGYVPAVSPGRHRRIVYVLMGYTLFLVSLRRNLPALIRHLIRSGGARRAARRATRQPAARQPHAGTPPAAATPAPRARSGSS